MDFIPKANVDEEKALQNTQKNTGKIIVLPDINGIEELIEETRNSENKIIVATAKTVKGSLQGTNADAVFVANGNGIYNPKTGEYDAKYILSEEIVQEIAQNHDVFNGEHVVKVITFNSGVIEVRNQEELDEVLKQHGDDIVKFAMDGNSNNKHFEELITTIDTFMKERHDAETNSYLSTYTTKMGEERRRIDIASGRTKGLALEEYLQMHPELKEKEIVAIGKDMNDTSLKPVVQGKGGKYLHLENSEQEESLVNYIRKVIGKEGQGR